MYNRFIRWSHRGFWFKLLEALVDAGAARSPGIAIMADAIALAVCDFTGRPIAERMIPLPAMGVSTVLHAARRAMGELLGSIGVDPAALPGIGVSGSGSFMGEGGGFNTPRALAPLQNFVGCSRRLACSPTKATMPTGGGGGGAAARYATRVPFRSSQVGAAASAPSDTTRTATAAGT